MLLPFQGANPNFHRPRALPWAGCLLAFQAVTSRKVYRTPIKIKRQILPYSNIKKVALCHNEQTAALLLNFGLGHVPQYTPVILNFSALHFTHSYTT